MIAPNDSIQSPIFAPKDALPVEPGRDMAIILLGKCPKTGMDRWMVRVSYRPHSGAESKKIKRIAVGADDLALRIAEVRQLTSGSLTARSFKECSEHYRGHKGYGSKADVFERNIRDLGAFKVDSRFPARYYEYILKISQGRAVNTVNNYRICIRSVLNFAYKSGFINSQPIRDFGMQEMVSRDRIWSDDERTRILNNLRELDSYLLPAVEFASVNPVRKADLFNLKRKDLDMAARVVRLTAAKTGKVTTLPNVTDGLIRHAMSLPAGCQWLFPAYGTEKNGKTSKLKPGTWKKIIDADKHWNSVLTEAKVYDFHFHDLKACAETYMIHEQGYTYADLEKLGIQCSPKTQKVYDRRGAMDIVLKRRELNSGTFVVPEIKTASQNY